VKKWLLKIHDGHRFLDPQVITAESPEEARRRAIIYLAEFMNWSAERFEWDDPWSLECRTEEGELEFSLCLCGSNGGCPPPENSGCRVDFPRHR
jgi:hypothetical protein